MKEGGTGAQARRVFNQAFRFENIERRDARRHRKVICAEGRTVNDGTLHTIEDLVKYPFPSEHRSYRDVTAGERFGNENHIRFDAPMIDCQKTARAAEFGLDLVSNEQGSVFAAKILCAGEIAIIRNVHPFTLNWLDYKGGHLAMRERSLKRREIVKRNTETVFQ